MSIKGKKPNKKNSNTSSFNYSKILKKLFTVLCFVTILAVPTYAYMQNAKVEYDLSVVGNGTPTVVQIHDPGCRLCNRLKSNLGDVKAEFKGKIQFKTANIKKQSGRDFAAKYSVPHVTLLFFNEVGDRVNTMQGVSSSVDIKNNLDSLVSLK